jgi:TonB family protein
MGGATELQEVVVTGYGVSEQEIFPTYSSAKPTIGNREYNDYLKENLQYPEQAQIKEIEGTVTLELTISPSGKISNIDIKKGLGYGCDEEAIRLINEGPKWNPAERDGNKVEEKIKVRVKFKIDK